MSPDVMLDANDVMLDANILDKVEVNGTANCFITLKDHKANFLNHPTTTLIPLKMKSEE